jgi:IS605 OrfB family transposase
MSRAVNTIWNFVNEMSFEHITRYGMFLNNFQLQQLTTGMCKDLGLSSGTVQEVCDEYALRRRQFKKNKLRWRSGKKSLGWIPLKNSSFQFRDDTLVVKGNSVKVWLSRPLEGKIKCANISQDARGHWYINIVTDAVETRECGDGEVGIDLGQKTLATLSNGKKYDGGKHYRFLQGKLAKAQRDGKKRRVKNIHAKIKNRRQDEHHKISNEVVNENKLIVVGNVSGKKLAKTRMAKSALDAGWSQLRTFLEYKAITRKGVYVLVNEVNTTRTCSVCGVIPDSSPRGLKGLALREWVCCDCGAVLDRDVNAAINILRIGHDTLSLK